MSNCAGSGNLTLHSLEVTKDTLTSRGGLALFVRYLHAIGVPEELGRRFGSIRRSGKGQPVSVLFHQLLCFFMDGTSRHLTHFDALKQDAGYAAGIELAPLQLASSHAIKRFFGAFRGPQTWLFRRVLQRLFLWRLRMAPPPVVVLGIDTMVMNNDEALKRHGVEPTYKKVKGFQPLQITWGRFVVDAVFRGGSKHSNADNTVANAVRHLVARLRTELGPDVPIVVRMDSGFFDQKLFEAFEALGIGYICSGKLLGDIVEYVGRADRSLWHEHSNGRQLWAWLEFGDRRGSWKRGRRAIYTRPVYEDDGQGVLEFARPDNVIYTNLGRGEQIDARLAEAGLAKWLEPAAIIEQHHSRGADELVHRSLKELASETLPFRGFAANSAWYYTMLVAHFLFECFKEDVTAPIVPVTARPTRLRRTLIDFAGKIVRSGGRRVLKVTAAVMDNLRLQDLWARSGKPPQIAWA
jgi:hypothetical protein